MKRMIECVVCVVFLLFSVNAMSQWVPQKGGMMSGGVTPKLPPPTVRASVSAVRKVDINSLRRGLMQDLFNGPPCRVFYFKNISTGSQDASACMSEALPTGGTNSAGYLCEFDKQAFSNYITANDGCAAGYSPYTDANRERIYICLKASGPDTEAIIDIGSQLCLPSYDSIGSTSGSYSIGTLGYFCELQKPRARVCQIPFVDYPDATDNSAFYDADGCGAEHFCCVKK